MGKSYGGGCGEHRANVEADSAIPCDQKQTYELINRQGGVVREVAAAHQTAAKMILSPDGKKGQSVRLKE